MYRQHLKSSQKSQGNAAINRFLRQSLEHRATPLQCKCCGDLRLTHISELLHAFADTALLMPLLLLQRLPKLRVGEFSSRKHQQTKRHPVRRARSHCSRGPQAIEPSRQFTLKAMGKTVTQAVHANAARPVRNSLPCAAGSGAPFTIAMEHALSPARNQLTKLLHARHAFRRELVARPALR